MFAKNSRCDITPPVHDKNHIKKHSTVYCLGHVVQGAEIRGCYANHSVFLCALVAPEVFLKRCLRFFKNVLMSCSFFIGEQFVMVISGP